MPATTNRRVNHTTPHQTSHHMHVHIHTHAYIRGKGSIVVNDPCVHQKVGGVIYLCTVYKAQCTNLFIPPRQLTFTIHVYVFILKVYTTHFTLG